MSDFVGKRIIVTGGAGGIGVETARAFMAGGGHVVMVGAEQSLTQLQSTKIVIHSLVKEVLLAIKVCQARKAVSNVGVLNVP